MKYKVVYCNKTNKEEFIEKEFEREKIAYGFVSSFLKSKSNNFIFLKSLKNGKHYKLKDDKSIVDLNADKYIGLGIDDLCKLLIKELPRKRETLSSSIECRERKSEDYINTYIGKVTIKKSDKIAVFKLYLSEHYFFQPKIEFKKVSGGIGYVPFFAHIKNNIERVIETRED